ncbi:hypothetical protein SELMODRAFT_272238 [Selaginella moellendorffii]|uniref:F-box domain-containing protein n=2 Tax=Selaginella moellendorffii TaxID=88036 RepID=D8T8D6_SELML|nr:F-box/kelch-repeat protein At5g15710 [Selaginella moellendorffii]XP_024521339.1 F-box/kelch-repeat protein At5g15710 isoform X2 [Selaginella moellendorffii]EFJ05965.1 hypothetical protein SELMODRAFT_270004 [Selaginella moellendorffii]EFJ07121.1 hypothetical protein SELMODRAFT_272238 [Selaginella moellendorffii]|eukprot:XP_002993019.1 F-box/kelch-repeat protein At5g15710 [Selaginella moellendorffii]
MSSRARIMDGGQEQHEPSFPLWHSLPEDIMDKVFAFMPIESLVAAGLVCKSWNSRIKSSNFQRVYRSTPAREAPWLLACSYNCRDKSCAFSPTLNKWLNVSLAFLPPYMRFPLAAIGGLIFMRAGLSNLGMLAVCNPIMQTWKELPQMTYKRFNSLVGVFQVDDSSGYRIIVAGGTSECGGDYECSTEIYDSRTDSWTVLGAIPRYYTVKITVWTSKTVFCQGTLYCLTSARPYNLMSYNLGTRLWSEMKVPRPACLYSSFLLKRKEKLLLVGGVGTDRVCERIHLWELQVESQQWLDKDQMPQHYFQMFYESKGDFDLKCAGSGDLIYFFKSSHSGMLVCDLSTTPASWQWLPSCPFSNHDIKFALRGLFLNPRLDYTF